MERQLYSGPPVGIYSSYNVFSDFVKSKVPDIKEEHKRLDTKGTKYWLHSETSTLTLTYYEVITNGQVPVIFVKEFCPDFILIFNLV